MAGQKAGAAILMSPGEEGNRLGILDLVIRNRTIADYTHMYGLFDFTGDPDDTSVRRRITRYLTGMRATTQGP